MSDSIRTFETGEPMVEFSCGARRSEVKPMYHKIPGSALRRLAMRYTLGSKYDDPQETAKISGQQNWQKGDEEFATEAYEHLFEHITKYADGDRSEDHLAAGAWGLFLLMDFEERGIIPRCSVSTQENYSALETEAGELMNPACRQSWQDYQDDWEQWVAENSGKVRNGVFHGVVTDDDLQKEFLDTVTVAPPEAEELEKLALETPNEEKEKNEKTKGWLERFLCG